jgi:serine/threonine-protein kinase
VVSRIGKYQLHDRIGRGGMGTVYHARDPVLERDVALKVISSGGDVDDELKTRFFREAQACARLSHPNIVTVYDLGEEDGKLFIVMELLEGAELKKLLADGVALSLENKLSIMAQVCDGLAFAHSKGIIHRDIKPGNIFVLRNATAKILDFGVARITTAEMNLTRTGLIVGTLRYMSPEQARGRGDQRSDIFSVGSVFYELLTGQPAFRGEDPVEILDRLRSFEPPPPSEVDPTLPRELDAILARALAKDPAARYHDLATMHDELEAVRRQVMDAARDLRATLVSRAAEVRRLEGQVAELIGAALDGDPLPSPQDATSLAALRELERRYSSALGRLGRVAAVAERWKPALEAAEADLERGEVEAACDMLERIVADVPEHRRAAEQLTRARAATESARRRAEQVTSLLAEAAVAIGRGEYRLALETLAQVDGLAPGPDVVPEIERLRTEASSGLAREELAAAQRHAEELRAVAAEAGEAAGRALATQHAAELWRIAEDFMAEGNARLAAGEPAEAGECFDEAAEFFKRAEQTARLRAQIEEGRRAVARARRAAVSAGAAARAAPQWRSAAVKEIEASTAVDAENLFTAISLFDEARTQYDEAAAVARDAAAVEARETEAVVQEATALFERGELETSLTRIETVLSRDPTHAGAADLRARVERAIADAGERTTIAPAPVDSGTPTLVATPSALTPQHVTPPQRTLVTGGADGQHGSSSSSAVSDDRDVTVRGDPTPRPGSTATGPEPPTAPPSLRPVPRRTPAVGVRTLVAAAVGVAIVLGGLVVFLQWRGHRALIHERALAAQTHGAAAQVDAEALAPARFRQGVAREREAAATESRSSSAAVALYRQATDDFRVAAEEAGRLRAARARADDLRKRMEEQKRGALASTAEFDTAAAHEKTGVAKYAGLAFDDAGREFEAAAEWYGKARPAALTSSPAAPAPPTAPSAPAAVTSCAPAGAAVAQQCAAIETALRKYAGAHERKDLDAIRALRPEPAAVERTERIFGLTSTYRLELAVAKVEVDGDAAQAAGQYVRSGTWNDGKRLTPERGAFTCALKRDADGWKIEKIETAKGR